MNFAHYQSPKLLVSSPHTKVNMASQLETTNDHTCSYLKSLAENAKKDDGDFMDIIKEFPVLYNRASADFKDRNIKKST